MLIISAGNVVTSGEKSRSLQLARSALALATEYNVAAEIVDLREYRIESCTMCEGCARTGECIQGDDFNRLAARWKHHAQIMVICPHYAGIPSRFMALLEKIQEMTYLAYCLQEPDTGAGFGAKSAIVIAHGGMTEGYEKLYSENVLVPLGNALGSCGCTVLNDAIQTPLLFGVKRYHEDRDPGSACFRKDDDTERSAEVLSIAVKALAAALNSRR